MYRLCFCLYLVLSACIWSVFQYYVCICMCVLFLYVSVFMSKYLYVLVASYMYLYVLQKKFADDTETASDDTEASGHPTWSGIRDSKTFESGRASESVGHPSLPNIRVGQASELVVGHPNRSDIWVVRASDSAELELSPSESFSLLKWSLIPCCGCAIRHVFCNK